MAKIKDIQGIQQDHFSKETKDSTSHYETTDTELEKYLDVVEKAFMKRERESAVTNKKEYLASKVPEKRDNLFIITGEKKKE